MLSWVDEYAPRINRYCELWKFGRWRDLWHRQYSLHYKIWLLFNNYSFDSENRWYSSDARDLFRWKEHSIDTLTQLVGSKIKCNNISLFLDNYPVYMNSWFRNVGDSNHIQCLWHLKKNWKKKLNINGLTGKKNISVLSLLNHLSMI